MRTASVCLSLAFLFCAAPAAGDTLVIAYGSGKVQTVELEGKAEDVLEVKLNEASLSLGERVRGLLFRRQAVSDGTPSQPNGGSEKPAAKVEWAAPMSE